MSRRAGNGRKVPQGAKRALTLEALAHTALAHLHEPTLLRELLAQVRSAMRADNAAILLLDAEGRHLTMHSVLGPEETVAAQVRIPVGKGIAGGIVASRAPLIVDDLSTVEVANPFLHEHVRSLVGAPLLVGERILGAIHVDSVEPAHFTLDDMRLLELIAERIAIALDHTRLLQTAEQRSREAEEARRQADQARREAEERAQALVATLEAMADGVLVYDRDAQIVQANSAVRALMGYDREPDFYGRKPEARAQRYALSDADGRMIPEGHMPVQRILAGELVTGSAEDYRVRTLRGDEVLLNLTGAPIRDHDGRISGAVIIARDVTERKRLERRTQEALHALLLMAETLVQPEAEPGEPAESAARMEAGGSAAPRYRSATAQRLASLTCDVLGCSRVGILAIEPDTQLQRAVAVVGLTPDQEAEWWREQEALQVRFGEGADPELLARFVAGEAVVVDMREAPYNEQPNPYNVTTTLVVPMRVGETMIGVLTLDYGGPPHTFTDEERVLASAIGQLCALVIERERLLRDRETARASELALRHANQRMDEFLHMVNHELHNPLAAVKSSIQLGQRQLARILPADATDQGDGVAGGVGQQADRRAARLAVARGALDGLRVLLERADRQTDRLDRLMNDLVDASRVQTGKLEMRVAPCDLVALVRESVREQRELHPNRTIHLRVRTPASAPIHADADRIGQVVTNYLTNALKYSPTDRPVEVTLDADDATARVAVRDEGPGVPLAEQPRVWERFHRAPGAQAHSGAGIGLGLGLYISRQIVERHGGTVAVESAPGQGATFSFTLPLPEPADAGANTAASQTGDG